MVILNQENKAVVINDSFTRMLGYDINDIPDVNHWFKMVYPNDEKYRREQERIWKEASSQLQREIDFSASGRLANVTCKNGSICILEIFGANMGEEYSLIVFIDITEKEKHRKEKESLIRNLNQALSEVNTLRGILPICSFCKKIRDDKGYWEQVEVYISKHSPVNISHSLCPECLKKQYPKMYEEIKKDESEERP